MEKNQKKIIALLLFILVCCSNLESTTETSIPTEGEERLSTFYFDSVSGSDDNTGNSEEEAWQSLNKFNTTQFQPGDTILFKASSVWNGILKPKGTGTREKPIRIDRYGGDSRPIFNGNGVVNATVLLENLAFWEINNLEITNTNGNKAYQGDFWGILGKLTQSGKFEHIHIKNCYIHDVNGEVATKTTGGIFMTATSNEGSAWYDGLQIVNNTIDRVGGLGIATFSEHAPINGANRRPFLNVLIQGNVVSNTGRNNVIIRDSDNAIVEHNTLINSSRYDVGHSIFCFRTKNLKIQYNEAYGNRGEGGKDRGGFDADWNSINTIIQYNYSHDNHWGFAIMKKAVNDNVVIRYNISENDNRAIYFYGFESEKGMTRAQIYNNTHYIRSGINLSVFGSGEFERTAFNTDFYNNIFYFEDKGSVWGLFDNVNFENNSFYNIAPQGTNYIIEEPGLTMPGKGEQNLDWKKYPNFLRGYQLSHDSPCIDAGKEIEDNGGIDFWGVPLYQGLPDIGASEYRAQ